MPSGSAVTADFRCSTFVTGTPTTVQPRGVEQRAQLPDALAVGASAVAHVDGAVDLEHVAAVEGAGQFDGRSVSIAEAAQGLAHGIRLGASRLGAGTGQHREVAEHDDRVLDEHRVGQVVVAGDAHRLEAPGRRGRRRRPPTGCSARSTSTGTRSRWVELPLGELAGRGADESSHRRSDAGRQNMP